MTENAGSKISCQDISPPKGFEVKNAFSANFYHMEVPYRVPKFPEDLINYAFFKEIKMNSI